ncbi:MAG TPA: DUF2807 domain-containing protein, partial [Sphingomicrobium sp.]|nr:DUF2807 domain-containing protein [Sphingomicrobium sp.]
MRTFPMVFPVIVAAMIASGADGATRNFTVTGFTNVRIEGPYKVRLATGVPPSAKATGSSAALD